MSQVRAKKTKNYDNSTLKLAVSMIQSKSISLRQAAKNYQIPKSTLSDKINNKSDIEPKSRTILTAQEETRLAQWVVDMSKIGFGRTRKELLATVKKILDTDGRKTPFRENMPGKDWYYGFVRRHPEITPRTPMQLSKERAVISPEKLGRWFDDFKNFMDSEVKDDTIFTDPTRWYNADESGFPLCPKSGKVLALRGQTNVYNFTSSDKTQITVLACMSATGHYLKPLIVYPGQRFSYNPIASFQESVFGRTESGWMDSELFKTWLTGTFIPEINARNVKKPVLLFVDGHSTHLSLEVSDICKESNVVLYCLLAHASHLIQPCDVKLFSSLKESWKQSVREFQIANIGECVTKKDFAGVFKGAWEKSTTLEVAIKGFRDAGLFPFDINRVLGTVKMVPSTVFTNTTVSQVSGDVNESCSSTTQENNDISTTDDDIVTLPVINTTEGDTVLGDHNYNTMDTSFSLSDIDTSLLMPILTSAENNDVTTYIDISIVSDTVDITTTLATEDESQSKENEPPVTSATGISSAFDILTLPNAPRKKTTKQRIPLPKAITGNEFRELMIEKQKKKDEELKLKQMKKERREKKKIERETEKERKQVERELKKREREEKRKTTQKNTNRKRKHQREDIGFSSEDEQSNSKLNASDSDGESSRPAVVPNNCYKCEKGIPVDDGFVSCGNCPRKFHITCLSAVDLASFEDSYFECDYC